MPTSAHLVWAARSMLSQRGRRRARRIANTVLSPLASLCGVQPSTLSVALTFDDGPDGRVTPALLDLLQERGARATFFVVTEKAVHERAIIQRTIAEGHEVALHCDRHDRLTDVPVPEVRRRLLRARETLETITERPVRFFRPPFGAQSIGTFLAARSCGLDVVVWGPYAEDWLDLPAEAIAARGLANLHAGDILLLHDGLEVPAGERRPRFDRLYAFGLLLDGIAERGLRATTVGGLLAAGEPRRTAWFRP